VGGSSAANESNKPLVRPQGRGTTLVDMMRDHIDQNLRCGADRLPLLLSLIDERLSFSVQALRLFDNRLGPFEKINQRLRRWQRFLNLSELYISETGKVTNEVNYPVFQHSSTLLIATH
jgi:hypothetical protein